MKTEDRTRYLLNAFGWQGGTIHQIAEITGCDSHDLLYAEPKFGYDFRGNYQPSAEYLNGFTAGGTCESEWVRETLAPKHQGEIEFWFGVMGAFNLREHPMDSGGGWQRGCEHKTTETVPTNGNTICIDCGVRL